MTKYLEVKLTEDQVRTLRDVIRNARVERARYVLSTPKFDQEDYELSYLKRLETTLVKQLTKS